MNTAAAAQAKSPRRIQAAGAVGGRCDTLTVRNVMCAISPKHIFPTPLFLLRMQIGLSNAGSSKDSCTQQYGSRKTLLSIRRQ